MIQEVFVIIGFPGSGKSTLMKDMLRSATYSDYVCFDNVFAGTGGPERFFEALYSGKSILVSDIQFTNASTLKHFVSKIPYSCVIKYHYFTNNPEQCKKNAIARNEGDVGYQCSFIDRYTANYHPIDPKPVWGET